VFDCRDDSHLLFIIGLPEWGGAAHNLALKGWIVAFTRRRAEWWVGPECTCNPVSGDGSGVSNPVDWRGAWIKCRIIWTHSWADLRLLFIEVGTVKPWLSPATRTPYVSLSEHQAIINADGFNTKVGAFMAR